MANGASYIQAKDYKECLNYIEKYWDKITCHHPADHFTHLGLPHKFVAPNHMAYKNDQFYWDSYFIIIGLVRCGREKLAKGMIDNFLFLQKRFNIIPMRNRFYNLGSSQPPFLTSMAREVFFELSDKRWMKEVMLAAETELKNYWMSKSITEVHMVYKGLSRYCDHFITHLAAEHESGWDMTSRFNSHCLDYLPVDLNCALFKYEIDLAEYYSSVNNKRKYNYYMAQCDKRRKIMNKLMWNEKKGFFFDYNYKKHRQSAFFSLAGFYPMWAKLATHTQAKRMVENLHIFEHEYGLANTQRKGLAKEYKQHDYPNGWPHQQWVVIKGLMNYGYRKDALRLAKKFLDLNKKVFASTGKLWEKYNVVEGDVGSSERYITQWGFGWTNAVFLRLVKKFENP